MVAAGIAAVATFGNDDSNRINTAPNPTRPDVDSTTATTADTTSPASDPDVVPAPADHADDYRHAAYHDRSYYGGKPRRPGLEAWPAAPGAPVPLDDIPRLLPTASITVAGTPVRSEADGVSAPGSFAQIFADADRDIVLTLQTHPDGVESSPPGDGPERFRHAHRGRDRQRPSGRNH